MHTYQAGASEGYDLLSQKLELFLNARRLFRLAYCNAFIFFLKSLFLLFPCEARLTYGEDDPCGHLLPYLANRFLLQGFPTPCPCWVAGEAHKRRVLGSWGKTFNPTPAPSP